MRVLKIFAIAPEASQTPATPAGEMRPERLPIMGSDIAAEEAIEPKPAQPEMIGQPEPRGFRGLSGISGQILPVMSVAATPELQQAAVRPAIEMSKPERLPSIGDIVPEPAPSAPAHTVPYTAPVDAPLADAAPSVAAPVERPRFAFIAPASSQPSPEPPQQPDVNETPAASVASAPNEQPSPSVVAAPKAEPEQRTNRKPAIDVKAYEPPFVPPKQANPPATSNSFELVQAEAVEEIAVPHRRTLLLRMKSDVQKTTVVDPTICDVVRLSPRELSVVGKAEGATHISVSVDDGSRAPQTYLVRVIADPEVQQRRERHCAAIQEHLHGLYPNNGLQVVPFGSLALLKGEAKNFSEALQILELTEALACQGADPAVPSEVPEHVRPPMASEGGMSQVINMLRIQSVQRRTEAAAPEMR